MFFCDLDTNRLSAIVVYELQGMDDRPAVRASLASASIHMASCQQRGTQVNWNPPSSRRSNIFLLTSLLMSTSIAFPLKALIPTIVASTDGSWVT